LALFPECQYPKEHTDYVDKSDYIPDLPTTFEWSEQDPTLDYPIPEELQQPQLQYATDESAKLLDELRELKQVVSTLQGRCGGLEQAVPKLQNG
jgi:hypothetical protein